jgi:hypothetical protein
MGSYAPDGKRYFESSSQSHYIYEELDSGSRDKGSKIG